MSRARSPLRSFYQAMPRSIRYVTLLFLIAVGLLLLVIRNPLGISAPDPRFERDDIVLGEELFPGIVRYVSELPELAGDTVFGLVLEAQRGVPTRLLNLTAMRPELGSTLAEFVENGGFEMTDEISTAGVESIDERLVEVLERSELEDRLLSPVDITLDELEDRNRFVVAATGNYEAAHGGSSRRLIAKVVEPTGAYSSVSLGGGLGGSTTLVDYGVSLGFVLLEDIDLGRGLNEPGLLWDKIAFFAANDLSDRREPLLEGDAAATRAGSHRGFLPLGPWMAHGRHLEPRTRSNGRDLLRLWLRIREAEPHGEGDWRQYATSSEMSLGPLEILRLMAEIHAASVRSDGEDLPRGIAKVEGDRVVLPAGSVVLTGTPPGTALTRPTEDDRVRLRFLGNFSGTGARRARVAHYERHRGAMGFLSPGDRVEACVERLGCQRWVVSP